MTISAAPTYDEFIVTYPAFGEIPQDQVERQIALSVKLLSDVAWDDWYGDAVGLDAAHNLFLLQQACASAQGAAQATAGPVNSVSAAGVSIGFQQVNWNEKSKLQSWYMKTIYGQQLLQLWDTVIPTMFITC